MHSDDPQTGELDQLTATALTKQAAVEAKTRPVSRAGGAPHRLPVDELRTAEHTLTTAEVAALVRHSGKDDIAAINGQSAQIPAANHPGLEADWCLDKPDRWILLGLRDPAAKVERPGLLQRRRLLRDAAQGGRAEARTAAAEGDLRLHSEKYPGRPGSPLSDPRDDLDQFLVHAKTVRARAYDRIIRHHRRRTVGGAREDRR